MGIFNEGYSTVDLARILGVHRVTVTKWIRNGALNAARTPGGRYVVSKQSLIEFLRQREIPIPPFLQRNPERLICVITANKNHIQLIRKLLDSSPVFSLCRLEIYSNPYEAITHIREFRPDLVFLDLELPGTDGSLFIENAVNTSPNTQIIAILGRKAERSTRSGNHKAIAAILKRPLDPKVVKSKVEQVLFGKDKSS